MEVAVARTACMSRMSTHKRHGVVLQRA